MLHDHRCRVVENRAVSDALCVIVFEVVSDKPFTCAAGQFVMIDLPEERWFFRRPMSVLAVEGDRRFSVFYRVVGAGTQKLAALKPGAELNVLGPLGNTFTVPARPEKTIVVGGGIGIAPVYWLGKTLKDAGQKIPRCYYGVRSAHDVGVGDELKAVFGETLFISTDDGSMGFHGNVCGLMQQHQEELNEIERAYICGPTRMMQAAYEMLSTINPQMRVEISMEEHMPCGTGACGGCVVFRADDKLPSKVCVEGPVFDAQVLRWPGDDVFPKAEASACHR